MPVFDFEFIVPASKSKVREFHRDTAALRRLTPPPTFVQLHEIEPLSEGSTSIFTLWVGPLPLRWKALHRDVSGDGFTDVQVEGPAARWEHTHTFEVITADSTRVRDHVEYEHQSGIWGVVTRILFARPNLYLLFTYRKLATRWWLRK